MKLSNFLLLSLLSFIILNPVECGNCVVELLKTCNGFHDLNNREHEALMYHHSKQAMMSNPFKRYWHKTWANEHYHEVTKGYSRIHHDTIHERPYSDSESSDSDGNSHGIYGNHDIEMGYRESQKGIQHPLSMEKKRESTS